MRPVWSHADYRSRSVEGSPEPLSNYVKSGQEVLVTERGRPVAKLVPLPPEAAANRDGHVPHQGRDLAAGDGRIPAALLRPPKGPRVGDAVVKIRGPSGERVSSSSGIASRSSPRSSSEVRSCTAHDTASAVTARSRSGGGARSNASRLSTVLVGKESSLPLPFARRSCGLTCWSRTSTSSLRAERCGTAPAISSLSIRSAPPTPCSSLQPSCRPRRHQRARGFGVRALDDRLRTAARAEGFAVLPE